MRAPLRFTLFLLALVFPFVVPAAAQSAPSGPQAGLPVETITVDTQKGPHSFSVEVAGDDESRERGLMYRMKMAPDAGMLFDFHTPQMVSFWMENTVLPLDMLFVRADGTIARIKANATPYSRENIPSGEPVETVIELNAGRAAALGIIEGDRVHVPHSPGKTH